MLINIFAVMCGTYLLGGGGGAGHLLKRIGYKILVGATVIVGTAYYSYQAFYIPWT